MGKKKRTIILRILILVLVLLAVRAIVLYRNGKQSEFTGSRIKNPEDYLLEITRMNGEDRHTMALQKSDVLQIDFVTEQGSLKLEITAPDGTVLYSGNGKATTTFTVTAPSDGNYQISVTAKEAKGSIRVRKK